MQPQMILAQERNEYTASVDGHDERGVRTSPAERRAVLAALPDDFEFVEAVVSDAPVVQTNSAVEPPVSGVRQRKPVRAATDPVCPKLIEAHLPLVHQVVAQICRRVPANVLRDDLLAAGVFGLVDSLRKNGGDGGETFEWYARTRIRGAVLDELRAQDWLTRRARDAVNAASLREDGEPDAAVLIGLDEVSFAEEQEFLTVSGADPEAACEAKETYQLLIRAIEQLPERERKVVFMHYLKDEKFKTIGAELGVSEPRVSQLHARALERLKSIFEERKYRPTPRRPVHAQPVEPSFTASNWENTLELNDPSVQVA